MNRLQLGLTLLELLVVMAIIAIVMTALLNWQMNSLSVTMRTNAMSRSLTDLNDATGYIGDRVRAAKAVRVNGFTVNGKTCDSNTPCLGILTTDADARVSPPQQRWFKMVYRLEPRGTWTLDAKVPNAWADDPANGVFVLQEYRLRCLVTLTDDCSTFKSSFNAAALSGLQPYLVTDSLALTGPSGTFTPFTFDPATSKVTLRLQYKQKTRNQVTFTPGGNPYTMSVRPRNVN